MSDANVQRELGTIIAKIDALDEGQREFRADVKHSLEGLDDRMRQVETRGAVSGAVSGGVVSVAMAMAVTFIKDKMGT